MLIHYFIVVLVIIAIIGFQCYIYHNTKNKIKIFKGIFPDSTTAYSVVEIDVPVGSSIVDSEEDVNMVRVSQLHINTNNPTLQEIRTALNVYLQKNKGAASDFYLMKDVVERYCRAKEEEINIQQPIPLYLGLMGTMVGIIIGIGFVAFNGGLNSSELVNNISSLMTCVAIAMAASFVGIFCTTSISWTAKNATSRVEDNKNRFYSWLQTELLPVLSGNAVNALYLLQQNLMSFNQTFRTNIDGLESALSKVEDSSKEQIELISLIRDIDIKRVAQANVAVLKELKDCTGEISVFNKYLHNVSGYLVAVNELNGNINEHLNRTAAIEKMGAFFEREIEQVASREQYINEVVAKVDDTLRKTFEKLSESTKDGVNELRSNSTAEFDALIKQYSEQKEEFSKMVLAQREELLASYADMPDVIKEIRNLAEVKSVMMQMLEANKEQSKLLDKVYNALNRPIVPIKQDAIRTETEVNRITETQVQFPKVIIYMVGIITMVVLATFGIYVYKSFIAQPNNMPAATSSLVEQTPTSTFSRQNVNIQELSNERVDIEEEQADDANFPIEKE